MARVVSLLLVGSLVGAGCAGDGGQADAGTVRVFAAASLTDAFSDMAEAFETAHPGASVTLNLAGSATLRTQILEGAPADVFAPADGSHLTPLREAGELVDPDRVFATNRLVVAVPEGNPGGVTSIADFARSDLLLGLCAEGVPCGDLARVALANAGVEPSLDTEEPDVRSLLTKVGAGELDAGIVYVTDVATNDRVDAVTIDDADNVVARYPIAVLRSAGDTDLAAEFVGFVLSAEGRAVLAGRGFGPP